MSSIPDCLKIMVIFLLRLSNNLEGGQTVHSVLQLPLNMKMNKTPACNLSKNCAMAKLLQKCRMIIWDEWRIQNLCSKSDIRNQSKTSLVVRWFCWHVIFVKHCQWFYDQRQPMNLNYVWIHQFCGNPSDTQIKYEHAFRIAERPIW